MRLMLLLLAAVIGMTGCVTTTICESRIPQEADRLNDALLAHPETPDAVGEPAVNLIVGIDAACP